MKNTITNYKGERLMHTDYATMDMIHSNNISKDDVSFILNARRAKKRAIRRKKRIGDIIYFLIGCACVFTFLYAMGIIENSTDTGWGDFWKSMSYLGLGLVIGWIGWNRGRHLEAFEELAAAVARGIIYTITYIVECVEDTYNFFKARFAAK